MGNSVTPAGGGQQPVVQQQIQQEVVDVANSINTQEEANFFSEAYSAATEQGTQELDTDKFLEYVGNNTPKNLSEMSPEERDMYEAMQALQDAQIIADAAAFLGDVYGIISNSKSEGQDELTAQNLENAHNQIVDLVEPKSTEETSSTEAAKKTDKTPDGKVNTDQFNKACDLAKNAKTTAQLNQAFVKLASALAGLDENATAEDLVKAGIFEDDGTGKPKILVNGDYNGQYKGTYTMTPEFQLYMQQTACLGNNISALSSVIGGSGVASGSGSQKLLYALAGADKTKVQMPSTFNREEMLKATDSIYTSEKAEDVDLRKTTDENGQAKDSSVYTAAKAMKDKRTVENQNTAYLKLCAQLSGLKDFEKMSNEELGKALVERGVLENDGKGNPKMLTKGQYSGTIGVTPEFRYYLKNIADENASDLTKAFGSDISTSSSAHQILDSLAQMVAKNDDAKVSVRGFDNSKSKTKDTETSKKETENYTSIKNKYDLPDTEDMTSLCKEIELIDEYCDNNMSNTTSDELAASQKRITDLTTKLEEEYKKAKETYEHNSSIDKSTVLTDERNYKEAQRAYTRSKEQQDRIDRLIASLG